MTHNPISQFPVSPLDRYVVPPVLPTESDHPLVKAVMEGKRFVAYPYVASLFIMTFRRTMGPVRQIETGQWPMTPLFGATLITTFLGWWGFPWGLVWSPAALFNLWNGGRDLTHAILSDAVGEIEAKRILTIAPKPRPPAAIWLSRALILLPVLLVGMIVISIASE